MSTNMVTIQDVLLSLQVHDILGTCDSLSKDTILMKFFSQLYT
jgi:hypothetical protein